MNIPARFVAEAIAVALIFAIFISVFAQIRSL